MLPPAHGGRLVDRRLSAGQRQRARAELASLPVLRPGAEALLEAEKIAVGALSPLEGFMDRATVDAVLATGRLPGGLPWPIPIVLAPPGRANAAVIAGLRPGDDVALLAEDGSYMTRLRVDETFDLDRDRIARAVYGTTDRSHPNVAQLLVAGPIAVAGRIERVSSPPVPLPELEHTPGEVRELFRCHGWSNVAAFQTRNVPHAGHEQLQRFTLEREDVDALFIHPLVGPCKEGDYPPALVVEAYRTFLGRYLPDDRVTLATLTFPMRYAGPKAALLFAIVRKNYGCSHYIVGRDQAGVGGRYDPYECHRIFDRFPIGIVPVRYRELAFCPLCGGMTSERSCRHAGRFRSETSQTRIRRTLAEGAPVPPELLRPEVHELLREWARIDRDPAPPRGAGPVVDLGPMAVATPAVTSR